MRSRLSHIGQHKDHLQVSRILGQAPITNLTKSKQTFNYPKRMLDPRTQSSLGALDGRAHPIQNFFALSTSLTGHHGDVPLHIMPPVLFALFYVSINRVAQCQFLIAVQQPMNLAHVMLIGCCAYDRMHQATVQIHTNMGIHAQMPLVALLGLVHLGGTRTGCVFCGTGGLDDCGIYDRALAHKDSLELQQQADRLRIVRLNQISTHLPGHRTFHLCKKLLASSLSTFVGVFCFGKLNWLIGAFLIGLISTTYILTNPGDLIRDSLNEAGVKQYAQQGKEIIKASVILK